MDDVKVTVVKFSGRTNLMLRYVDPVTGKQKHKSAETSNRKDAIKAAGKWEGDLRRGIVASTSTTWATFRRRYEDEVLSSLAESTDEKVQGVFNSFEKYLAPVQLRGVTADRISYWQLQLRQAGRSENTIKGYSVHLMVALRWAASVGMLANLPNVKMPKRASKGPGMKGRPITGEEFDRLLAAVPKIVVPEAVASWQHYLRGLWSSGLRLAESLELSWDDESKLCVDMQPGELPMLKIPAGLEKGHRDRLLPMAPEFADFLAETPEERRVGFVFSPRARKVKRSQRLVADFVGRVVSRIGETAGIIVKPGATPEQTKHATAHDLRRSFGLRWASRVMPQVLMELMRHETINTTMVYYVGRNAQSTAAVLWAAVGKQVGKHQPKKADIPQELSQSRRM